MFNWVHDLYILLTAKIPAPRTAMVLAVTALVLHLLMQPWDKEMTEMGLYAPVLAYLLGHMIAFSTNLPYALSKINPRSVIAMWLAFATALMMAPTMQWAQHAVSIGFLLQIAAFIVLYWFGDEDNQPLWFARDWKIGQRNAANWYVTRGLALVLLNETLISQGSPTDWIVGLCLGNVALHYLLFWTVLATHPFEDAE